MPKPSLPDDLENDLPCAINGWLYDTDDTTNGHVWRSNQHDCSVGVFDNIGSVSIRATDDRVRGFKSNIEIDRIEYNGREENVDALRDALETAREWMAATDPQEWAHPDVCEEVFDAPPGYELEVYYLEKQEVQIYYRREDAEPVKRLAGAGEPDEYTRETCPYLRIHAWRGSDKTAVTLAPWRGAHGQKCKYAEVEEIDVTPDRPGLELAVTAARRWARDGAYEAPTSGQTDLDQWKRPVATDGGQ